MKMMLTVLLPVLYIATCVVFTNAAPAKEDGTVFDQIFNIPLSVIGSVNQHLNENAVKCPDGSVPDTTSGKPTCHDSNLNIPVTALQSVNQLLNTGNSTGRGKK